MRLGAAIAHKITMNWDRIDSISISSLAMFRNSDIAWFRVIDIDVMNVIDSKSSERDRQMSLRNRRKRDCAGKPNTGFPYPALAGEPASGSPANALDLGWLGMPERGAGRGQ